MILSINIIYATNISLVLSHVNNLLIVLKQHHYFIYSENKITTKYIMYMIFHAFLILIYFLMGFVLLYNFISHGLNQIIFCLEYV